MQDLSQQPVRAVAKPKHKRRTRQRVNRGKFSETIRQQIKEHFENTCQECNGIGDHIHHVKPKGSGSGRGVFTNGLLLCNDCHMQMHAELSQARLKHWQSEFEFMYGPYYYMDSEDLKAL
ncbi:HNH endonuclease signature motif containing protein [Shouchella miscanthi]|uniref:HNH endonuclease signature motif containing protein n=1 Tax=Shouchella miscanthi TaxID=2598861 RepID=UPI00119E8B50|nr:HNH endonuclease signature motif containing protein [Shouchella miscanthi]